MSRVKVFFTVDVEIWPGAWTNIDARFPDAFEKYVYGRTRTGEFGLPFKLRVLSEHGLKGVFFVEPLFSARFGKGALQEVLGLIVEAGHEVQLHMHPEWIDEARTPLLRRTVTGKVQFLSDLSIHDQSELLRWSKQRILECGGGVVSAFRAGSFAFNRDTLAALEANDLFIDSSYNHFYRGPQSGIWGESEPVPIEPFHVGSVLEYPVTVFEDVPGHVRALQLAGCSLEEMTAVLQNSIDARRTCVVIVSHNFELLDRRDFSCDAIVTRRFVRLCEFVSRNADVLESCGFRESNGVVATGQPKPVKGSWLGLSKRIVEQVARRF